MGESPIHQKTIYYAPSFVDRIMAAIERLPGPYWAAYLVFFILEVGALQVVAWLTEFNQLFVFEPVLLIFPFWLCFGLAVMTYLNGFAGQMVSHFCTLLNGDDETEARLRYEFTVMPARPVVINSLFWVVIYFILWLFNYEAVKQIWSFESPYLIAAVFVVGLASFTIGSAIYYQAIRQLFLVHRTLAKVESINIFQLDPVYAFSRLTARIGISRLILLSVTVLLLSRLTGPLVFVIYGLQGILALCAFVLPLWSIHTRLVAEKRELQDASNLRMQETLQLLSAYLDEKNLAPMDEINKALASLVLERETLSKIPTWPWRTETLRGFASALLLPVLLLLIQLGLQLWLGN